MQDLLFGKVNFPPLDKQLLTSQIMSVDKKYWFRDDYRATNMLSLMTKNPIPGPEGTKNSVKGEFQWLPYTPTALKDWFEKEIFPWMGTKTRIMALLTHANDKNNEHIDCDEKDIGTLQHKFRYVIKGKTSTLYFKNENKDVFVPEIDGPFIMDGSWPHGMYNFDNDYKLTIAAGSPWNGNVQYSNLAVLMKKSELVFPKDYKKYLKK
jgi:hypothetical protein